MHTIGVLSAILSALVWGSGDFVGGLAVQRSMQACSSASPFPVVLLASVSGAFLMWITGLLRGETMLTFSGILWSCGAGIFSALGIAALYKGLAKGSAALVAPTSGVIGAALPVIVGSFLEGLPGRLQLVGILIGLVGIWIVSRPSERGDFEGMSLIHGATAGLGFGGFFVLIAQVGEGWIFLPLVVVKITALIFSGIILLLQGDPLPRLSSNPPALLAGILDAGGNVFYLLATNYTTLSVAALLSSMYPVSTILLAITILRQRINRVQGLGIIFCILAVALIST